MVRVASVNVNGIRAAFRKGMADWLEASDADVVTLQEVRAETSDVEALIDRGWTILHDACSLGTPSQQHGSPLAPTAWTPRVAGSKPMSPCRHGRPSRW
jgi:hypothetical protein